MSPADEQEDMLDKALLRFNMREQYEEVLEDYRRRTLKDAMWIAVARTLRLQSDMLVPTRL